jgi:hypothetical protein
MHRRHEKRIENFGWKTCTNHMLDLGIDGKKLNLSLSLIKHHTMKTHVWGNGGTAARIRNLSTRWM